MLTARKRKVTEHSTSRSGEFAILALRADHGSCHVRSRCAYSNDVVWNVGYHSATHLPLRKNPMNMSKVFKTLPLVLVLVAACGGPSAPGTAASTTSQTSPSKLVPPGEAKTGDRTLCPVSKEAFTVEASSPRAEYMGKTYYFCCPGCDKKFMANPQKYVGGTKS